MFKYKHVIVLQEGRDSTGTLPDTFVFNNILALLSTYCLSLGISSYGYMKDIL